MIENKLLTCGNRDALIGVRRKRHLRYSDAHAFFSLTPARRGPLCTWRDAYKDRYKTIWSCRSVIAKNHDPNYRESVAQECPQVSFKREGSPCIRLPNRYWCWPTSPSYWRHMAGTSRSRELRLTFIGDAIE